MTITTDITSEDLPRSKKQGCKLICGDYCMYLILRRPPFVSLCLSYNNASLGTAYIIQPSIHIVYGITQSPINFVIGFITYARMGTAVLRQPTLRTVLTLINTIPIVGLIFMRFLKPLAWWYRTHISNHFTTNVKWEVFRFYMQNFFRYYQWSWTRGKIIPSWNKGLWDDSH